jgi:DNA invertase Pin-like site-specific DNA recombinase
MIAVYIRVSTVGQNEEGQRREIGKWLSGNGIDHSNVLWFTDKETGDNLNRPSFERLQKKVFDGQIKTIVCYKLDRLSRSLKDGINVLCNWCERGIRVVSTSQQIDFNGTVGKMIASILFAIAELEQETRRERQAAGIAVAKERGIYGGRKKGATKLGVDTSRAVQLREQKLTYSEIAAALKVSVSSVRRYLKSNGSTET